MGRATCIFNKRLNGANTKGKTYIPPTENLMLLMRRVCDIWHKYTLDNYSGEYKRFQLFTSPGV